MTYLFFALILYAFTVLGLLVGFPQLQRDIPWGVFLFWIPLSIGAILGFIHSIARRLEPGSPQGTPEEQEFAKGAAMADSSQNRHRYAVVGMKYRGLPASVLESFCGGYVRCDRENRHDPHAVAVCDMADRCVGFIPRPENEEVYEALQNAEAGKIYVDGQIWQEAGYDQMYWHGAIYIDELFLQSNPDVESEPTISEDWSGTESGQIK